MAVPPDPFYGCLCLITAANKPLPPLPSQVTPKNILPEIHFNIWEEASLDRDPFLDIGVMLDFKEPAERIEIFLPWVLLKNNIEDLSPRLFTSNGVSAVFNEAWTSSTGPNSPGVYVTRSDGTVFTIVPYDPVMIETRNTRIGDFHSIVLDVTKIKDLSTDVLANSGNVVANSGNVVASSGKVPDQMYLRIRVKNVPRSFYRVGINQGDAFGGGALYSTEIIDFRLNVRRGVPPGFESILKGRFVAFSKVQLFLMKSRDQDIVFEDKLFKSCRSLEDENFWAEYILPENADATAVANSKKQVQDSLGYQWRKSEDATSDGVKEFGTLARFKSFTVDRRTATLFFVLALFVGVAGNAVYDALGWGATKMYTWYTTQTLNKEGQ